MILCRLSSSGFSRNFRLFPSFCQNAFFFLKRKKKYNCISFSLSFFLSFANASVINERAGEGERESFGDDENTVYE